MPRSPHLVFRNGLLVTWVLGNVHHAGLIDLRPHVDPVSDLPQPNHIQLDVPLGVEWPLLEGRLLFVSRDVDSAASFVLGAGDLWDDDLVAHVHVVLPDVQVPVCSLNSVYVRELVV